MSAFKKPEPPKPRAVVREAPAPTPTVKKITAMHALIGVAALVLVGIVGWNVWPTTYHPSVARAAVAPAHLAPKVTTWDLIQKSDWSGETEHHSVTTPESNLESRATCEQILHNKVSALEQTARRRVSADSPPTISDDHSVIYAWFPGGRADE